MAQQKVVIKVTAMIDQRTKQKAMGAISDIYGIDSIAVDLKDQKITVIGQMDTLAMAKKLKKLGKVDIVSVGPAKEEKKDGKK
ncbi:heavy metal-associated isoprenylated plant protein 39-like protein isoform X1 [Cinnamomum micranthum f. kanehirae]|uniref:Heavy metal-associated isoprenylated plant protein 39-like protein isoform X1 n=1 Tax=Cinnamomum micranthum f. kanehirae TaxID=337451 RepID=A0A443N0Y9_9MAGN|nr:heavy metal-associated isoprenylated plant protein 39-like protein isoform X1 [Cinnamomum micranthum f. kanehirae]